MNNVKPDCVKNFISTWALIFLSTLLFFSNPSAFALPDNVKAECEKEGPDNYDNVHLTSMRLQGSSTVCGNCWFTVNDGSGGEKGIAVRSACVPVPNDEDSDSCSSNSEFGNPIHIFTGEKTESTVDITAPIGSMLEWGRTYSSFDGYWDFPATLNLYNQSGTSATYISEPGYNWAYLNIKSKNATYHYLKTSPT